MGHVEGLVGDHIWGTGGGSYGGSYSWSCRRSCEGLYGGHVGDPVRGPVERLVGVMCGSNTNFKRNAIKLNLIAKGFSTHFL